MSTIKLTQTGFVHKARQCPHSHNCDCLYDNLHFGLVLYYNRGIQNSSIKMKSMISREEKKDIAVARKYKLRLLTMKLAAFRLFDEGYSQGEVRYILRDFEVPGKHSTFSNTIRRYYASWKKAQPPKTPKQ